MPLPQRHLGTLAAIAAVSAILAVAIVGVLRFDTFSGGSAVIRGIPQRFDGSGSFGMLPEAAQLSISRALGNDIPAYWARRDAGGFATSAPRSPLRASFSATGVQLRDHAGSLGIALSAYGEGSRLRGVAPVAPSARRARVTYARGPLREWYANGPIGLEQGLDLASPPVAHGNGHLTFSFTISGSLSARQSGPSVLFETASGHGAFREGALGVYDATGRLLPATLSVSGRQLLLRTDAVGAHYPLRIDPNFCSTVSTSPQLCTTTNNAPSAIAASGNTLVVGDPYYGESDLNDFGSGAAWLFIEPAAGWQSANQTATLAQPSGGPSDNDFGSSVAITTAPGGQVTVAVGDPLTNNETGSIDVYVEPKAGWPSTVNPTAEITVPTPSAGNTPDIGGRIEMSSNSAGLSTIVSTGAVDPTSGSPAVAVYAEPSSGTWASTSTPTSLIDPDGGTGNVSLLQGTSVAIATDPSTNLPIVAVTAYDSNLDQYEVQLYSEPAGGWSATTTTAQSTLAQTNASPGAGNLGTNGLLLETSSSVPHETVFASNPDANNFDGAVYVWTEPAGGWPATAATANATLTANPVSDYFGEYLALDSTTLIVGAYHGDIYAFGQPAGGWADASAAQFAAVNTNGASWSGTTYSIAGACTDVFLGDLFTESVDILKDPTASTLSCQPSLLVKRAGGGAGSVSGPKISCGSSCTATYTSGTDVTLTAKPASGSGFAGWSGGGCSGTSACTVTMSADETVTATFQKLPVVKSAPVISGSAKPGHTLTCSQGKWSGASKFGYQWVREGVALYGNTGKSRKVATLDEGSTLNCEVTGSNKGVSKTASSKKLKVPIPFVKGCPGATGSLTGSRMGLIHLGMTQAQARRAYSHHTDRGKQYEDFFCLTPIGVRVGYASPKLLKTLPSAEQKHLKGTVVWASTSNPHYALDGVRAGESVATATAQLDDTAPPLHIGLNYWYLAVKPGLTLVMKVRGHAVQEVGIAINSLTQSLQQQSTLMHSFE